MRTRCELSLFLFIQYLSGYVLDNFIQAVFVFLYSRTRRL